MNIKKLEIFGDSVLRGVMYDETLQTYRLRDGYALDTIASEGITVKNNSRMGATVGKSVGLVEKKLSECNSDTLVIFEYGGNDCDYDWKDISESPRKEHSPHTSPEMFVNTYREMILSAKKKGATVALTSLVPIDCSKYMKWICRNLSYENILSWLGDESMLFRWQEYYSHLVENLARELECCFIDLRRGFLLSHEYDRLLCADGIHPTQKGHEMIEKTIANFVCI